jgi:molecular chaperone HtpG
MYTNPLDTVREYVQNAFDSIRMAERQGAIKPKQGRAEVLLDPSSRSLTISDNGIGVKQSEVLDRLLDVGMSTKEFAQSAGFRGIGRLAGIAYCSRLTFTAHAPGEPEETTVLHDCAALRKSMRPSQQSGDEMQAVLERCTDLDTAPAREKGGYFRARMEDIHSQEAAFLDVGRLTRYLEETAPVAFDLQRFGLASDIYRWLKERGIPIPEITLVIRNGGNNYEVLKPYNNGPHKTARENIPISLNNVRCFPDAAGPESMFWGWYALTDLPGAFADPAVSGLRARKDNIGLGETEVMRQAFREVSISNERFNNYFMGEIHVLNANAIPNARRDGFEETDAWLAIRRKLVDFARERSQEVRKASDSRSVSIEKLTVPTARLVTEVEKKTKLGLASENERNALRKQLEKHRTRLSTAEQPTRNESDQKALRLARENVDRALHSLDAAAGPTGRRLSPSLGRKESKLLNDVLALLYEVLDEASFDKARKAIIDKYGVVAEDRRR